MAEPLITPDMSIPVEYVERLAFKASGVQGREAVTDPDSGSTAADDDMIDTLQETPGGLSRLEINLAPSIAPGLVDGLEYLIDYPFG